MILGLVGRRRPLKPKLVSAVWFVLLPASLFLSTVLPYDNGSGDCPSPILNGGFGDGVLSGTPPEDPCVRSAQQVVWFSGGLLFGVYCLVASSSGQATLMGRAVATKCPRPGPGKLSP